MASEKVARFKEFVREHPKLVNEVRNNNRSWQQIYEEWEIFGSKHEIWDSYLPKGKSKKRTDDDSSRSDGNSPEALAGLLSLLKKIDIDDLQKYISQFGGVLSNVQKVMDQFVPQGGGNTMPSQNYGPYPPQERAPFSFRKD